VRFLFRFDQLQMQVRLDENTMQVQVMIAGLFGSLNDDDADDADDDDDDFDDADDDEEEDDRHYHHHHDDNPKTNAHQKSSK
jgi:hypothetical protein